VAENTIAIGGKTYDVPESASAAILEDCEEEVKRLLALRGIPTGADARALRVVLFRVLSEKHAGLTEDEVKRGLAAKDQLRAFGLVLDALGFVAPPEGETKGEAASPSTST
jgi:hypothetical protein